MKIEAIFSKLLQLPVSEIRDDLGPQQAKAWSSLRHHEILTHVESEFQVKFTTREFYSIQSVGQLRKLLQAKGIPDDAL